MQRAQKAVVWGILKSCQDREHCIDSRKIDRWIEPQMNTQQAVDIEMNTDWDDLPRLVGGLDDRMKAGSAESG